MTGDAAPIHENDRDHPAPSLREKQEWFADLAGADMAAAEDCRIRLWRDVVAAFESHDVLAWPADPTDPYRHDDEVTAMSHDWSLLLVAPLLNLPAISVPCGFSARGIPRGLQITGRPGGDLQVMQVAYACEQATRYGERRPPSTVVFAPGTPSQPGIAGTRRRL